MLEWIFLGNAILIGVENLIRKNSPLPRLGNSLASWSGRSFSRIDTYLLAVSAIALKLNNAVDQGKQSIVPPHTDIIARVKFSASLAHENTTCRYQFPAVALYPQALGVGISAVAGATTTFFMSHSLPLSLDNNYAAIASPSLISLIIILVRG